MSQQLRKQTNTDLIILGAGGHAKVVLASLARSQTCLNISVHDQNTKNVGQTIGDFSIKGFEDLPVGGFFHVAIGNNSIRQRLYEQQIAKGFIPKSLVDSNSILELGSVIGTGSYVAGGAIVSVDAVVGGANIVNHGAIVEHDCQTGDYCHLAPNSTLLGGAKLGKGVLLGAGAVVLPQVTVADNVTIGAGAVLSKNIDRASIVVAGVPANQM